MKSLNPDMYVCHECCSEDIQEKMWVDVNSVNPSKTDPTKFVGKMDRDRDIIDEGECWCPDCDKHTRVVHVMDYGMEE